MKLIKFIPFGGRKRLIEPSVTKIPQWWRDGETVIKKEDYEQAGMKACVPFMEIMMSGYTVNLPFDVFVSKDESGNVNIKWNGPSDGEWPRFIAERPKELGATIPRPAGHLPNHFVWLSQWSWKTPRGYSVIVTHPFNRFDLPFTTLSATMDSDKFHGNGNVPFFLKEDFEGVIPMGTPIMQIFPFKRDKWKSWIDDSTVPDIFRDQALPIREPGKSYKKLFWVKKVYE